MPQTFFDLAAWRVPRPQPPATANSACEPCEMCLSASSLHFGATEFTTSPEESLFTGNRLPTAFAPARWPAIQLSTDGIFLPPTAPTTSFLPFSLPDQPTF